MYKAKEILEKQLQLLSELLNNKELSLSDICLLTGAMCEVARQLDDAQGRSAVALLRQFRPEKILAKSRKSPAA